VTVLEAFRAKTVFYDNQQNIMAKKVLSGGHVAQWPVIGDDIDLGTIGTDTGSNGSIEGKEGGLQLGYHVPGDFIAGRKIKMSEQTVRVDDMLVAAIDVPFQDLDLSHFDVIRPYATKLGRSLAIDNDKKIATIAMKAAQNAGVDGIYPGGQLVTGAVASNSLTGAFTDATGGVNAFVDAAHALAEKFDDDHVPEDGRYLFIGPHIRKILRHDLTIFNRDYNPNNTAGSLNERVIGTLAGFNLVLTTHLPSGSTFANYNTQGGATMAKYDYDCSATGGSDQGCAAIAMCGASEGSAAVGMVQAGGVRTVIEDDERRNVDFCVRCRAIAA
tara:strand:- start:72 stop:1058 length:987 start_codon:yes stop_codon:yes gene_type:complete